MLDQVDVSQAIESLRNDTPLRGLLYDCAGRAFRVHVWTSFQREKREDLPVPEVWTQEMAERGGEAGD